MIDPIVNPGDGDKFYHLLEVYVDDFIGLIQCNQDSEWFRFLRALLYAIIIIIKIYFIGLEVNTQWEEYFQPCSTSI